MRLTTYIKLVLLCCVLSSCVLIAPPEVEQSEVTLVVIFKTERKLFLLNENELVDSFDISLGFEPIGHKEFEGDGKTPEGAYRIDKRNPRSKYFLSLGISYPNQADRAHAQRLDKDPGGEIFIHGESPIPIFSPDWTAGCIAVSNEDMLRIYTLVKDHTPIHIYP